MGYLAGKSNACCWRVPCTVSQPRILLLDEATSHLDTTREAKVNTAIAQLQLTRIIVAHRPETIASADRVIDLTPTKQTA